MTTKYEIEKDSFEIRGRFPQGLTVEDIRDLNAERHDFYPERMESFDDLETARQVFEKTYRSLAKTDRYQGWHGTYVEATFYDLVQNEYDEDGDLDQGGFVWETATAPLPAIDDEEGDNA